MEQNDAVLFGHLVLYHIVDAQDHQQNIQLWHSDYSNNGSKAIIDVRYVYFNLNFYSSFLSYKKNVSIFLDKELITKKIKRHTVFPRIVSAETILF